MSTVTRQWKLDKYAVLDGSAWRQVDGLNDDSNHLTAQIAGLQLLVYQGATSLESVSLSPGGATMRALWKGCTLMLALTCNIGTRRLRLKFTSVRDCEDCATHLQLFMPVRGTDSQHICREYDKGNYLEARFGMCTVNQTTAEPQDIPCVLSYKHVEKLAVSVPLRTGLAACCLYA